MKVFRKIEAIVREERNAIDSQELVMQFILPEEYYIESGIRDVFADDMFSLKDRSERAYVLGPTHEELFVEVCRDAIKFHKDMPIVFIGWLTNIGMNREADMVLFERVNL